MYSGGGGGVGVPPPPAQTQRAGVVASALSNYGVLAGVGASVAAAGGGGVGGVGVVTAPPYLEPPRQVSDSPSSSTGGRRSPKRDRRFGEQVLSGGGHRTTRLTYTPPSPTTSDVWGGGGGGAKAAGSARSTPVLRPASSASSVGPAARPLGSAMPVVHHPWHRFFFSFDIRIVIFSSFRFVFIRLDRSFPFLECLVRFPPNECSSFGRLFSVVWKSSFFVVFLNSWCPFTCFAFSLDSSRVYFVSSIPFFTLITF